MSSSSRTAPRSFAPLRVVQLRISGFKGITVADITPPETGVVVVSGKNGAGKSSLLDAIAVALGGGPENRKIAKPISQGRNRSQVVVDLGDIVVTREWQGESSWLTVTNPDGTERRSPQTLLNSLLGKLSFDPTEFLNKEPSRQRDMLLQATGLGQIVNDIDQRRKNVRDERLLNNRRLRTLQAELDSQVAPDPETPIDEVTVSELVADIRATENTNQQILAARRRLEQLEASIAETKQRIADMQESLAVQEFEYSETEPVAQQSTTDISALERSVADINDTNARIRAARRYRETQQALQETKGLVEQCDQQLNALDSEKERALAEADLPVPGLAVDDDGILYNGVPFKDANTASRLRTATAIAMALNPTIRIIRVSDGSLLDKENLAALDELAADRGYQVWVERIADDDGSGIVIREGTVVRNDYQLDTSE